MHPRVYCTCSAHLCINVGIYTHNSVCISASSCGILVCAVAYLQYMCTCVRGHYCLVTVCSVHVPCCSGQCVEGISMSALCVLTCACPYIICTSNSHTVSTIAHLCSACTGVDHHTQVTKNCMVHASHGG